MSEANRSIQRRINSRPSQGILRRLLRNEAGNVLAITAAATIPMLGVVGGAVDISRLYLTKSRIQSACDSAVLAGRKAMTTTVYTDAAKTRARSMFNVNFQDAEYGVTGTTFTTTADAGGKVSGTVTTTVPMVLMNIFGVQSSSVTVNCAADVQIPNIDIVFVLDVTGSMNDCPDGYCNNNPAGEVRKIVALRAAVKDFYATLQTEMAGNTVSQLRYAFVPYSQAVNGGDLFKGSPDAAKGELPLSHISDTMMVESRQAVFETGFDNWKLDPDSTPVVYDQVFAEGTRTSKEPFVASTAGGTNMSNTDCGYYSRNLSFKITRTGTDPEINLYPRIDQSYNGEGRGSSEFYQRDGSSDWTTTAPTGVNAYTKITFNRVTAEFDDDGRENKYETCTRRVTRTRYIKETDYRFTRWVYKELAYNIAQYKAGTALNYVSAISGSYVTDEPGTYTPVQLRQLANQTGLTPASVTWDGCLEERTTVAASTFSPIPSAAKDLNFLDGGTSDELRWRPILRDLTYMRGGVAQETDSDFDDYPGRPAYSCPSARMRNLNVMTETDFNNYVDTLQPAGNTYLDVGMIWGLRLISPQGMFANRNLTGPNGGQITRHIIFLTDGVPVSSGGSYSAYGVEDMEERITGNTGEAAATLHARRFQALCDATRGSINVWAIAFGTSVTGNLTNCADPGRALEADNPTELSNAFRTIAQQIADLRLVQ